MTATQINNIIQSLQENYMSEIPTPSSVVVYKDSVKPLESLGAGDDVSGWYQSTVKINTDYVSSKNHKIHVKFKLNKQRVQTDSIAPLF